MSTIKHQASFEINRSAKELFPLFSAEGEKLWVPSWDYENVMGSTDLHEDYVFLTAGHPRSEHHGSGHHSPSDHSPDRHAAPKTIWLVKRHEPANYFVQFYRVEPGDKVGIVTVHCKPITQESTEVEVAYEYIGLSKKGNDFVAGYTAEDHKEFISHWPKLLADYFEANTKTIQDEFNGHPVSGWPFVLLTNQNRYLYSTLTLVIYITSVQNLDP